MFKTIDWANKSESTHGHLRELVAQNWSVWRGCRLQEVVATGGSTVIPKLVRPSQIVQSVMYSSEAVLITHSSYITPAIHSWFVSALLVS